MQILNQESLNATITQDNLGFESTAEIIATQLSHHSDAHAWVAQSEAKKAALFGLKYSTTWL